MTLPPRPSPVAAAMRELAAASLQAQADLRRANTGVAAGATQIERDTTAIAGVVAERAQADANALARLTQRLNALMRERAKARQDADHRLARIGWRILRTHWLIFWLTIRWWLAALAGLILAMEAFPLVRPYIEALIGGGP